MTIPRGFRICDRSEQTRDYPATGAFTRITYATITNGRETRQVAHSFDDLPALTMTSEHVRRQSWMKFGHHHRPNDQPAVIINSTNSHGTEDSYAWFKNGFKHRKNGPAYVSVLINLEGKFLKTEWYGRGQMHNSRGPAFVRIRDNKIVQMEYRLNGNLHRKDGPAYYSSSSTQGVLEKWFKHGFQHRTDGPCTVLNGEPKQFFNDGISMDEFEVMMLGYEFEDKKWVKI